MSQDNRADLLRLTIPEAPKISPVDLPWVTGGHWLCYALDVGQMLDLDDLDSRWAPVVCPPKPGVAGCWGGCEGSSMGFATL